MRAGCIAVRFPSAQKPAKEIGAALVLHQCPDDVDARQGWLCIQRRLTRRLRCSRSRRRIIRCLPSSTSSGVRPHLSIPSRSRQPNINHHDSTHSTNINHHRQHPQHDSTHSTHSTTTAPTAPRPGTSIGRLFADQPIQSGDGVTNQFVLGL